MDADTVVLVKGSRFMRMERDRGDCRENELRNAAPASRAAGRNQSMLLELAIWLGQDIRAFNVFGYITLRTVLAALTALGISFIFGPAVIRWLAAKKIGQAVRDDGPKSHLTQRPARRPWAAR